MHEPWGLAFALLAGALLGMIFYGGLWWTVQRGVSSRRVALWFLASLLLRMGVALAGFYFVAGSHWERMLLCLVGFVMARSGVKWLTRPSRANQPHLTQEAGHAP
mgnify:CR=1 FL=1